MIEKVDISLKQSQRWFWPDFCLLCQGRVSTARDLCTGCEQSLPRDRWGCPRCAAAGAVVEGGDAICGECQNHPPAFDGAQAVFRYASPVDKLIQQLKYHGRLELSRVLGGYLAEHLLALDDLLPDVVIPVPLHVSRLRERGYNQSLEIARFIARRLHVPLDWEGAKRIRPTVPQAELPRDQRRKNVRGAFTTSDVFFGRRVAIVDDVMTSGHTVNALAESLRRSGAQDVQVWVVARA
ncbi:MAG TPA: ComF family protein [Sulfuricaulis sp.]|nr:ComF family protein [Sulfuricaulis sp.]